MNTVLRKQVGATSYEDVVDDSTKYDSTTATSYTPTIDTSYSELDENSGPLTLGLGFWFNNTGQYVQIGMVRLTLEHD